jgi:hypothetical protein
MGAEQAILRPIPVTRSSAAVRIDAEGILSPGRFTAFLAVLLAAAYPNVVTGSHTFFFRDFALFGYPLEHYARESFWRGEIPLWNPYSDCGIPFLAQWNTLVLYPLSLFNVLLPLSWALGLFCLGHLLWAGLGMYLLARRWTGSQLAAAAAGTVFAFNGLSLNCLMWPNNIAALAWAPWFVNASERAWTEGGRAILRAGMIGGVQMLAGAPEVILLTWVLIAGLNIADPGEKQPEENAACARSAIRRILRLGAVALIVAGLSAAQLLPFLDLLAHSHRDALPASAGWAMPPLGWINLVLPLFETQTAYFGVAVQTSQHWTSSYYLGIGSLALAIWAAVFLKNRRVRWLAAAAVLGLVFALGNHGLLYPALRKMIPQIGEMRYPIKCVVLTVLTVPLLTAYAVANCLRPMDAGDSLLSVRQGRTFNFEARDADREDFFLRRGATGSIVSIALVLGVLLAGALGYGYLHAPTPEVASALLVNGAVRLLVLGAVVALCMIGRRGIPRTALPTAEQPTHKAAHSMAREGETARPADWVWALLPLVLWVDVMTHAPCQNPTVPRWAYAAGAVDRFMPNAPRPALGQTRAMVSPQADYALQFSYNPDPVMHCLSRRAGLFNNLNLLEGIPKINGMYSLYPKHEAEVLTRIYASTNTYPQGLADFLGVSHVSARSNLFSWETRPTALPLITAGQTPVFADSAETLEALASPSFQPRAEVYLPRSAEPLVAGCRGGEATITPALFNAREIVFQTSASHPAMAVIAQTDYHWWKGYLDGKPAPILRANHAFQAIALPAGRHRVELRYQDRSFLAGCLLSLLTFLACGALWWAYRNQTELTHAHS